MALAFHVSAFECDYHLYVVADLTPAALTPAPEWEWVADPASPNGGYSRRTGRALTDSKGHTLYDIPVHIATLDGREVRGARVRIRELNQVLPALRYLRPTGDVVVETNNRGQMTVTCDSIEPISTSRHGEVSDVE